MLIKGEFDTLDSSVIENINYVGNLFKRGIKFICNF